MKKRIVLWGSCSNDEKCLLALELREKDNKVDLYIFPEAIATETFYNQMMNIWREGNEVPFPEEHEKMERDLAITEDLLPDDIKVDRPDVITRAKAEWHFVVLSAKLFQIYNSELEDLKERVDQLKEYDEVLWEEMKSFWAKVQEQANEKNIFKGHAMALKEKTNKIFDQLKDLKKILDQRFREESRERAATFREKLKTIEEKIEQGLGLKPIFEELKRTQGEFHGTPLTRKDRRKTWEYLDELFKKVKEKRFGDKKGSKGATDRVSRRYDGLVSAIGKMEKSIKRDRQEQEFQNKRISETDGQLEMQIRQAKIKMIDERIRSKEEKLEDMYRTRKDLEERMSRMKEKEEEKKEEKKIKEAKEVVKEKIASEMEEQADELEADKTSLKKAAEKINESMKKPEKKESLLSAISETMGESLEDVVDTVKAVADVIGDKIEEATEDIREKMKEKKTEEDSEERPDVADGGKKSESPNVGEYESPNGNDDQAEEDIPGEKEKDTDSVIDKITGAIGTVMEETADAIRKTAEAIDEKIDDVIDSLNDEEE